MREGWHVLEPATPYVHGWHVEAICEHLEAASRGEIRKLIVNMPPRCMKSLLVSVFWFAWTWTYRPETRWLYSSYADVLSTRDSLKCRRLIQSRWYRERFGGAFYLTSDQNLKTRFENSRTGQRIATGIGGVGTGEGGDFIIVDDPHKVKEAESETQREGVTTWWDETMSTRGNDPKTVVRVVVMQRVHESDLSGHLLAKRAGYEHLCLPMRYEDTEAARARITGIGFQDPRRQDGELLWPERFAPEDVEELERELGPYGAAGQLQQRPAPRAGGFFRWAWFKPAAAKPAAARRVRYWDTAGTEGAGDYTAGVLMSRSQDGIYTIEHVHRGQWSPARRDAEIVATAKRDGPGVAIWLEQESGVGGKDRSAATVKALAGYPVRVEAVTGAKEHRADPLAAQAEAGNVRILAGDFVHPFLTELCSFPAGKHDDQVDAAAGAFAKLALTGQFVARIGSGGARPS